MIFRPTWFQTVAESAAADISAHTRKSLLLMRRLAITGLILLLAAMSDLSRAQWVQCNGSYGGSVQALTVSKGLVFAGTNGAGVFRSTDSGSSWNNVNNGLINTNVTALASVGSIIFLGTEDSGICISTNGGFNWESANTGLTDSNITALTVSGKNVFVGTGSGVFLSTDSGLTWILANNGLEDTIAPGVLNSSIITLTASETDIFAATNFGNVFHSTDNGNDWSWASSGLPLNDYIGALAISGSNVFAGTLDSGVYLSTDNGLSWNQASNGLPKYADVSTFLIVGTDIFAGTYGGVYLSSDDGTTWNMVDSDADQALVTNGSDVFSGAFKVGIRRTTDNGNSWTVSNIGLINTTVSPFAVNDSIIFAGSTNGLIMSTDNGSTWSLTSNESAIGAMIVSGNVIFTSDGEGTVLRSTNNGNAWDSIFLPLNPHPQFPCNFVTSFAMVGDSLFAGTSGNIFLSTDMGNTWVQSGNGLLGPAEGYIISIVTNGTTLFAGGDDDEFYRSTDEGNDWVLSTSGLPKPGDDEINALIVSNNSIFAGMFINGVFRSTDGGESWELENGGLIDRGISSFATYENYLFAGSPYIGGVFLSSDDGATWKSVNTGLTDTDIGALAVFGTNLFAGTGNSGVWRRPLSDFGISSVPQTPPPSPSQIQSYPNPFSSQATITFTNENEGYAEVTIVNLLGSQVARLYMGELSAGKHSFSWDASSMAPGMYECVVNVGGQTQRVSLVHLQ